MNSWAASIQTNFLTAIAEIIAYVFDTISLLAISLLLTVIFLYKNYYKYSLLILAAMGGDALVVLIAKTLVHSLRPLNSLVYEAGFSFPSGHTTASIVFCGLLTYLAWKFWNSPKAKTASITIYVSIVSIVALDRIYLNVHWFSDVVGGCLLGLFWLTFSLWAFRYLEKIKKFQRLWTKRALPCPENG